MSLRKALVAFSILAFTPGLALADDPFREGADKINELLAKSDEYMEAEKFVLTKTDEVFDIFDKNGEACGYSDPHILFENNYSQMVGFRVFQNGHSAPFKTRVVGKDNSEKIRLTEREEAGTFTRLEVVFIDGSVKFLPVDMNINERCAGRGKKNAAIKFKLKKDGTMAAGWRRK
jgi:hypothetical protein